MSGTAVELISKSKSTEGKQEQPQEEWLLSSISSSPSSSRSSVEPTSSSSSSSNNSSNDDSVALSELEIINSVRMPVTARAGQRHLSLPATLVGAAPQRMWSTYAEMNSPLEQAADTVNNETVTPEDVRAVNDRLTSFLKEQRISDQQITTMPGTRTSFSREIRRRRYSNALIDVKAAAKTPSVQPLRPFSATPGQQHRFSLPETRGFAQLSLRNMRQCWAEELPKEDEEDAKYMTYYLDENREGLVIDDVIRDVPRSAKQFSHGGSELKADKKNRVEEMKLGKLMSTLDSQRRSMEVLLKKQQQLIKWKQERKAAKAKKAAEDLRASEARHDEFMNRQQLFDNAIQMLNSSGDRTIAQIYRQEMLNSRIKELRDGGHTNVKASQLARQELATPVYYGANRRRFALSLQSSESARGAGVTPSSTTTQQSAHSSRLKSHDRLIKHRKGISKIERQLHALKLMV